MYRTRRISKDDLLISLRNYLLVFQTSVHLPEDIDIQDNLYGLRIDSEGLCYATLNLPDYMNTDIIKQGFMEDYIEPKKNDRYFLGVTPNIYRLTGFQKFKSIRQKLAVNGALNMPEGYTALVSLPTGGGKSLITQTMAYQKKGRINNYGSTYSISCNGSSSCSKRQHQSSYGIRDCKLL